MAVQRVSVLSATWHRAPTWQEPSFSMPCIKDNLAKAKACYASKFVQVGLILYTVCSVIASMISAITAFQSFKAAAGEFNSILQNWKTPPITSITVSATGECPSGYQDLPLPKWPGTCAYSHPTRRKYADTMAAVSENACLMTNE